MRLKKPTKELVETYRREFEDKNKQDEDAIKELFKIFPDNTDYKSVLLKSVLINTFYYTQIRAINIVARHIVGLDIDARLKQGDLDVVEQIANVPIKTKKKEKKRRNYSFATKYCSFHQPDLYPIYDSIVAKTLKAYQSKSDSCLNRLVI